MSYFVSAFLFNKAGVPRAFLILVLGLTGLVLLPALCFRPGFGQHPPGLPRAFVDGTEPGWRPLAQEDFTNVNCDPETWTWKNDSRVRSSSAAAVPPTCGPTASTR